MSEASKEKNQEALEQTRTRRELTPAVDIYENEAELLVVADVPGVSPEGLELRIEPPELRIVGKLAGDAGSYVRAFRVDERIQGDKVTADLKDGVLAVHLPKLEKPRARRIEVRTS